MCDSNLGCQLRTNYYGFRLGATGSGSFDLGYFDNDAVVLDGNAGAGFDVALTFRRAGSDSPQDGSFEGFGINVGYMGEYTARGNFMHLPYISAELWTYDAQLTPYLALMYTHEDYGNGLVRHGGRIEVGTQWRPWTAPTRGPDRVNPYIQGAIFIGGEGNGEHAGRHAEGGLVIGLRLAVGLDFWPLF